MLNDVNAADNKHGHDKSNPEVLPVQKSQYSDHKEQIAEQMDNKAGEEIGKRIHIAIDPFD